MSLENFDFSTVFDSDSKQLDIVLATAALSRSKDIKKDFEVFIDLLMKNCCNETLILWTLKISEINGAVIKRLFLGLCPQLDRKYGNVAFVLLSFMTDLEKCTFNSSGALSAFEARNLLEIIQVLVKTGIKLSPSRLRTAWESVTSWNNLFSLAILV